MKALRPLREILEEIRDKKLDGIEDVLAIQREINEACTDAIVAANPKTYLLCELVRIVKKHEYYTQEAENE